MAIDPVCGMTVDEKTAQNKSDYKGNSYYFCSAGCKKTFDADPEKYLKGAPPKGMPAKKPWWKFW